MNQFLTKYASHLPVIFNGVVFQIGWWICMLAPTSAAIAFTVLYLAMHIKLLSHRQWLMVVRIIVVGWAMDSFLSFSGLLNFANGQQTLPVWLLCIWIIFAVTPFLSLRFLNKHLLLACALGLFGGGLTYAAGDRLRDDINLGATDWPIWQGGLVIGLIWAVFLPLVFAYLRYQKVLASSSGSNDE